MGQRLPGIDQSWASLAARGFQVGAQGEIDKNNRDRDTLNNAAAALAGGIIRKKTTARQDKIRAEENAREDAIRREGYARQDARTAKEDARYAEHRQAEKDAVALSFTDKEIAQTQEEAAYGATPEAQMAARSKLEALQSRRAALGERLTGFAASKQAEEMKAYATKYGADPFDMETPATPAEQAAMKDGGFTAPPATVSKPAPVAPTSPVPTAAAKPPMGGPAPVAPPEQADAPPLTESGRKALGYSKRATALEQRKADTMAAVAEIDRTLSRLSNPMNQAALMAKRRAALEEANRYHREASDAEVLAKQFGEQADREVKERAVAADRTAKVQQVAAIAKTKGPFVTGAFLRALKEGVTDPQLLMSVVVGAMKPEKAPKETPEQKGVDSARTEIAKKQTLDAAGMGKSDTGDAKLSARVLARWAKQTTDWNRDQVPDAERWEAFHEDELKAVMDDDGVDPAVRQKFREAWEARVDPKGLGDPDDGAAPAKIPAPKWVKPEDVALWDAMTPEQQAARAR